jgi:hypothetical protein
MMLSNTHEHTTFVLVFSFLFRSLRSSPSFPSPSWHSSLPLLSLRTKFSLSCLFLRFSYYSLHFVISICHLSSLHLHLSFLSLVFFHPFIFLSFLFILHPAPLPHLIVLGAVSKSTFPMPHHLGHNHLMPAHIPLGDHITMHTMHVQTLQRL